MRFTPIEQQSIDPYCVRIIKENKPIGSGTIIRLADSKYYVVTAKHVLINEKVHDLAVEYYDAIGQQFMPQKVQRVLLSESDDIALAEIILDRHLKEINIAKFANTVDVAFLGFPEGLRSAELITRYGKFTNHSSNGAIRIEVESKLETNIADAHKNTDNFSGSGVWSRFKNIICFIGVFSTYESSFGTATIIDAEKLNKILTANNLPPLNYSESTDFDISPQVPLNFVISNIQSSLKEANELVQTLHPTPANKILTRIYIYVSKATFLPLGDQQKLLAQTVYLLAFARGDLGEESNKYILEAHEKDPSNITYLERTPLIQYQINGLESAVKASNNVLMLDPENERVWGFLDVVSENIASPIAVRNSIQYKTSVMVTLRSMSDTSYMGLNGFKIFYDNDIAKRIKPNDPVYRSEIYFWDFFARYTYQIYLKSDGNVYHISNYKDHYPKNELLVYCHLLLESIIKSIETSELSTRPHFVLTKICFYHTDFLLNDNVAALTSIYIEIKRYGYLDLIEKHLPLYIIPLINEGEHEKVDEILGIFSDHLEASNYLIAAGAYVMKDITVKANANYLNYIRLVENLESDEFDNLIAAIEYMTEHCHDLPIIIDTLEKKEIQNEAIKDMALVLVYKSDSKTYSEELSSLCKKYENHDSNFPNFLLKILATAYVAIDKITEARAVLKPFVKLKKEGFELYYYIYLTYRSIVSDNGNTEPTENREILELLEYWRINLSPNAEFLHYEIMLLDSIDKYETIVDICRIGIKNFPNDQFFVFSWVKANNEGRIPVQSDLSGLIDTSLDQYKFHNILHKWYIAEYCCQIGKKNVGLDIFHKVLSENIDDFFFRQEYFRVFTKYALHTIYPDPETIQDNSYVQVRIGENIYTDDIAKTYQLFPDKSPNFLKSKNVGEKFDVEKKLSYKLINCEVVGIFSPQNGIFRKIAKEVELQPDHYNKFSVMKIDENEDPKQFFESLKSEFGLAGTRRKLVLDGERNRYLKAEIGFTLLSTTYGDPFNVYNFLTKHPTMYFPTVPIFMQQPFPENTENYQFVLDFTSLLTIRDIQNEFPEFNVLEQHRYIISQSIIDFLNYKIHDSEESRESPMQMDITVSDVNLFETPLTYHEQKINEYIQIKEWVTKHCTIEHTVDSLGLKVQLTKSWSEEGREDSKIFLAFIDAQLLANNENRILVTDDLDVFKHRFVGDGVLVSSENYFKNVHSDLYLEIVHELVRKQFRGITIDENTLWSAYEKDKLLNKFSGPFYELINKNFSAFYNPDQQHFIEVIRFILRIYSQNIDIKFKRHISKTVLGALFKERYIHPESARLALEQLNKSNQFSPMTLFHIYQDLHEVNQRFRS